PILRVELSGNDARMLVLHSDKLSPCIHSPIGRNEDLVRFSGSPARVGPTTPKQLGAVTVHYSMVASIQTRVEPRTDFPDASVDPTDARKNDSKVNGELVARGRAFTGSNPVAPTIFLASLFCGSFWGFTWFNRKVEFS